MLDRCACVRRRLRGVPARQDRPVAGGRGAPLCGLDEALDARAPRDDRRRRQRRRRGRLQPAARRGARGERVRRAEPRRFSREPSATRRFFTRAPATWPGSARGPIERMTRARTRSRARRARSRLWDPDREIAECLDLIEQARHRATTRSGRAASSTRRKKICARRAGAGAPRGARPGQAQVHRATARRDGHGARHALLGLAEHVHVHEGIGEQIVAASAMPFTIVRPACSSRALVPRGLANEGINTSAPLLYPS